MIPYWHPQAIPLPIPGMDAPLQLHVFGLLVGTAVLFGSWLAQRRAEETGLSPRVTADCAIWMVIIGFLFAHWVSVIFYFPDRIVGADCSIAAECINAADYRPHFLPSWLGGGAEELTCQENGRCNNGSIWSLALIWNGISSFGGFLGAFVAILIFFRVKKITLIPALLVLVGGKDRPILKYLDAFAYGMAGGWIFGRAGCASAHDHIGKATDSFLSVRFPKDEWPHLNTPEVAERFADVDYIQRFDLGFLEMLYPLVMLIFFHFWARKQKDLRPGWYAAVLVFFYGPMRFVLDSLRATDIAHADPRNALGMTPGQIGSILIMLLGCFIWYLGGKARDKAIYTTSVTDTVEIPIGTLELAGAGKNAAADSD